MSKPTGFLCGPRVYEYSGWLFEYGRGVGIWPLKKDGNPRERMGRKFLGDVGPWLDMSHEVREKYRIGGGCREL